ncbi:MAG: YkgJ family cysteine cluster protein [Acidobacteria bacterium]|jgi:Fe-S-cluster containining protein|nr:YkgJ family cysteine cluster protein [Acidobacteriota bacterium]
MSTGHASLPEFLTDKRQLAEGEIFNFTCHPGVPCFNSCCADVNIVLTPIDVLRLARRLEMDTRQFLEIHTSNPITKDLQLPIVMLKMTDGENKPCPFVGEQGCTVYEDRPWACRMYPLGMAIPPARAGEEPEPIFFVFEDDHCKGRLQADAKEWTAKSWRDDQGIEDRESLETGFRDLVSHPWFIGGRTLDPKRMHMFYTACYDIDTFRSFVFESSFLEKFEIPPDELEELKTNDEALLRFAFKWLRFAMFAEPTMKVREGVVDRSTT